MREERSDMRISTIRVFSFVVLGFTLIHLGCKKDPKGQKRFDSQHKTPSPGLTKRSAGKTKKLEPYKTRSEEKVDPMDLKVVNINVGDSRVKGASGTIIDFQTRSNPDYVKWTLCSLSTLDSKDPQCKDGVTVQTKILLPFLYGGKNRLTITACANKEKVISGSKKQCGSPALPVIFDTGKDNPQVLSVYASLEDLLTEAEELTQQIHSLSKESEKESEACAAQNAQYEKRLRANAAIFNSFLRIPSYIQKEAARLFYAGLVDSNPVTGGLAGGATDALSEAWKVVSNTCNMRKYSGSVLVGVEAGWKELVCPFGRGAQNWGKMMFYGVNPAHSIIQLIQNIQNITEPGASVAKECPQLQILSRSSNAILERLKDLSNKTYRIKNELVCLGEVEGRCCQSGCRREEVLKQ